MECERCKALEQTVKALSKLIDLQELPQGFTMEDFDRLLTGKPLSKKPETP